MSSRVMNFAGAATNQHVEGFEMTEPQYSPILNKVVSMLVSLMHYQGKGYHHHLICTSCQLHPDFL